MDEIVSNFIAAASLLNLKPTVNRFAAWQHQIGPDVKVAGSVSELQHIDPMLPCTGDIDVMNCDRKSIVVPQRGHVTGILPDWIDRRFRIVTVFEMAATDVYIGYLKMLHIGDLHLSPDGIYSFKPNTLTGMYAQQLPANDLAELQSRFGDATITIKGPAGRVYEPVTMIDDRELFCEYIRCSRCLTWPTQAVDWPQRCQKRNWPDAATVARIVNNGCDVVAGRHPRISADIRSSWFRLSFSRAETVLLNSWTPVQEIVYHLMRVVLKSLKLDEVRDESDCRILSNYHLKTLMLWSCEIKDSHWWTSSNVVVLSSNLFGTLQTICAGGKFSSYFVTACNIFECNMQAAQVSEVIGHLRRFSDVLHLTRWLIENYIGSCLQTCSLEIRDMLTADTPNNLFALTSNVIERRRRSVDESRFKRYKRASSVIISVVAKSFKRYFGDFVDYLKDELLFLVSELRSVDSHLFEFMLACSQLQLLANIDDANYLNCDCLAISVALLHSGSSLDVDMSCYKLFQLSVKLFQQLLTLKVDSYAYVNAVALSHITLHRTLQLSTGGTIHTLSNVYLAVLYFIAGNYHEAANYCEFVSNSTVCHDATAEWPLSLRIDYDIDRVLGLLTLYQFLQSSALPSEQRMSVGNNFSVKQLVSYIKLKCSLHDNENASAAAAVRRVSKLRNITDYLLSFVTLQSAKAGHRHGSRGPQSCEPPVKLNARVYRHLLMSSAVEHLTCYHQFLSNEFSSVCSVAATDARAMSAFIRGLYQQCLSLSQRNFVDLGFQTVRHHVILSHCMTSLADANLASVTGLTHCCRGSEFTGSRFVSCTQVTLSLYLTCQCELKLKHPMMSLIKRLRDVEKLSDRLSEFVQDALVLSFVYRKLLIAVKTGFYC